MFRGLCFLKTNEYNNLNWYINENDFDQIHSSLELITESIYNDTSFFVSELSDTSCYSTGLNYFLVMDLLLPIILIYFLMFFKK